LPACNQPTQFASVSKLCLRGKLPLSIANHSLSQASEKEDNLDHPLCLQTPPCASHDVGCDKELCSTEPTAACPTFFDVSGSHGVPAHSRLLKNLDIHLQAATSNTTSTGKMAQMCFLSTACSSVWDGHYSSIDSPAALAAGSTCAASQLLLQQKNVNGWQWLEEKLITPVVHLLCICDASSVHPW